MLFLCIGRTSAVVEVMGVAVPPIAKASPGERAPPKMTSRFDASACHRHDAVVGVSLRLLLQLQCRGDVHAAFLAVDTDRLLCIDVVQVSRAAFSSADNSGHVLHRYVHNHPVPLQMLVSEILDVSGCGWSAACS